MGNSDGSKARRKLPRSFQVMQDRPANSSKSLTGRRGWPYNRGRASSRGTSTAHIRSPVQLHDGSRDTLAGPWPASKAEKSHSVQSHAAAPVHVEQQPAATAIQWAGAPIHSIGNAALVSLLGQEEPTSSAVGSQPTQAARPRKLPSTFTASRSQAVPTGSAAVIRSSKQQAPPPAPSQIDVQASKPAAPCLLPLQNSWPDIMSMIRL
jgi:hypothetical protein